MIAVAYTVVMVEAQMVYGELLAADARLVEVTAFGESERRYIRAA